MSENEKFKGVGKRNRNERQTGDRNPVNVG